MKKMQVTARIGKEGPEHSASLNFAENLDELVEQFGEEVVFSQAKSSLVVALQGFIRGKVNAKTPVTGTALQTEVDAWKPGVRTPGVGRVEKMKEKIASLTPEQKAELLAALTGSKPAVAAKPAAAKGKK